MRIKTMSILLLVSCLSICSCSGPVSGSKITVTDSLKDKPVLVGDIPCDFPLSDKDETLNIIFSRAQENKCEDCYVWQKYEEMTGVHVNWTTVLKDKRKETTYNALVNKQDIDLILRCKLDASLLVQYGENGYILDLAKDDMLKNYAPNCYAYLQSHPQALASVTNPDGTIYALPQVNSGAELRVSKKIFINKDWLERLNLELPATTEEFYEILKAFKEQDANGNGDPDDEIPFYSQDWGSIQNVLWGSFGLSNRGVINDFVDCNPLTNDVRLIAASDEYKAFLEYCNRLYSEGLLDPYIFTTNDEQWNNKILQDSIGVFPNTNLATVPASMADHWIALGEPLEGPFGDKQCAAIRPDFHSTGAAVIPATCENPELVLKWLDYFWTDEGTLFYHMGIEGETFIEKEDGTYSYVPAIYDEMERTGESFDSVLFDYSPYPGGNNPTVEVAPYFAGGEMEAIPAAAARSLFEYGCEEYWPSFTFTSEENEIISTCQYDMVKYINSSRIEFVTGEKTFDTWDKYLNQLKQFDQDKVLDVYRAAVERYEQLKESVE